MANRPQKSARPHSISPPELPDETAAESSFDGVLSAGEHYTEFVLSNRNLAGQTAARVTIQYAHFREVEFAGAELKFLRLTDTRFDHCDLANLDWSQSTFNRIEIVDSRMTGVSFIDSDIKNASFEGCTIDLALFRVCSFKDCRFLNCNLREAEFNDANLQGVVFSSCDLRGVQMYGANLNGTDFRGSQLEGLQVGIDDLRGAIIEPTQLLDLADDLARLIGLKVLGADEEAKHRNRT